MLKNIQNLFLDKHGSYYRMLQFETISLFVIILIFFTYFFNKNYGFVIILIAFSLYFSDYYIGIKNSNVSNFNEITMVKLDTLKSISNKFLQEKMKIIRNSNPQNMSALEINRIYDKNKLDSLYMDANIIHFLYSIKELSNYNLNEFFDLLKGTNSLLTIKRDIDEYYTANGYYPENTSELFEAALEFRKNILNNLHNFIYTIPKISKMYKYLSTSTNRYAILISRVTDWIYQEYKKNIKLRGINANTKFVTYNTTKPYDYKENYPIIPGDSQSKIVRFYL
jgi:hypothetical protein